MRHVRSAALAALCSFIPSFAFACRLPAAARSHAVIITNEHRSGYGSGLLLANGYVLTNQHVAGNFTYPPEVHIYGHTSHATLVASDRDADLALLKLAVPPRRPVRSVVFAPRTPQVGQGVVFRSRVQRGEVRTAQVETISTVNAQQYAVTLAGIYGDSGSAMWDCQGRVAGLVVQVRAPNLLGTGAPLQLQPAITAPRRYLGPEWYGNLMSISQGLVADRPGAREANRAFARYQGGHTVLIRPEVVLAFIRQHAPQALP